jgi:hypothetical protein
MTATSEEEYPPDLSKNLTPNFSSPPPSITWSLSLRASDKMARFSLSSRSSRSAMRSTRAAELQTRANSPRVGLPPG